MWNLRNNKIVTKIMQLSTMAHSITSKWKINPVLISWNLEIIAGIENTNATMLKKVISVV